MGHLKEIDCTIGYMNELRMKLYAAGHEVFFGLSGAYSDRHNQVNFINPDLYLAGHINGGGGSYALLELDHRAGSKTKSIATHIADELVTGLPVTKCDTRFLKPGDRGFSCIGGVHASAILLEPLFIDNPNHLEVLTNDLDHIGQSIFMGIQKYILST
jgi:N-acetylmuramoyl-L-alanine amidase